MLRLTRRSIISSHVLKKSIRNLASTADADAPLRNNVKMLGSMLGQVINSQDQGAYESVEKLRALGREWRHADSATSSNAAFDEMVNDIARYNSERLRVVARSFAHFLALSNSAENVHRIRRLDELIESTNTPLALAPKIESSAGSIDMLINEKKISADIISNALSEQKVEIVMTAHPTEVNRRTMIQKHKRIGQLLRKLDKNLSQYDRRQITRALKAEVTSIWESDELRRSKPTPVDEAKAGLAMVENVLWNAVPNFLRKLDDVTQYYLDKPLPLAQSPLKMATWMGGDRDGNPNVVPETTREVSFLSRRQAATLLKQDVSKLRSELSMRIASSEVIELANGDTREPYRAALKILSNRLDATIIWSDAMSKGKNPPPTNHEPLRRTDEIMTPMLMMHKSLIDNGSSDVAEGQLVDTIRRLATFGLCLLPMDIRQESTKHTQALTAITNYLGIGSYSEWDEYKRREWLASELVSMRPLLPRGRPMESLGFDESVLDTLGISELASSLEEGSLGAYVISQCQQASDVLAVYLLQQNAGVHPVMRVVPLFETLDDLERSADTVRALFSTPGYLDLINYEQEIMVGYSDSAKDAGRLAASWAQYEAQEEMAKIAQEYGVKVTFFHGKGGTVGRGGNPAVYQAIIGHPPHTINGRFRVTEQGEMITQNFGEVEMAVRTFDLFTAGTLTERFTERPVPKQSWRDIMRELSTISCDAYRAVVRGEERFVPYFRSATPELELAGLNVGSRPAKRNPKGGVESLRAIPWVFAWTQTRFNLPTWLGVGESLTKLLENDESKKLLLEMYSEWPWFTTNVDLLEMILVKSESRIAENYDKQLVSDEASMQLGKELREKMTLAINGVQGVSGSKKLCENQPLLLRSLDVRNPYVDPLNIIQAEILKRIRSSEQLGLSDTEINHLNDTLLITINGVANGMRNSG